MQKILEIIDLSKQYGNGDSAVHALRNLSFDVYPGEFLGIMGASGSGKSTLLNCLSTLLRPTDGEILFKGRSLVNMSGDELAGYRAKSMGYLFQNFELLDHMTGAENILLGPSIHGSHPQDWTDRLAQQARIFGIADVLEKFPNEMSGGQRQRVAAVRAIISNPEILFADEPTGALDSRNAATLLERLRGSTRDEGRTTIMVTHDPEAAAYCSRILRLSDGEVVHELRLGEQESQQAFYERIIYMTAQLDGGKRDVL